MEKLLDKITSYNIFTYFLPGLVFSFLVERYTSWILLSGEVYKDVFIIYFIGLVISRIGSVIIEPILVSLKFVKMGRYEDYVAACKINTKVEVIHEVTNTYRSLLAAVITFCLLYLVSILETKVPVLEPFTVPVTLITAVVILMFSFRKQSKYLTRIVKCSTEEKTENKKKQ